jgi:pSer/pThr/pTyr-binding forkhead associated (FHA) protein
MSNLTFKVYRRGLLQATESFDREIIKIGRLSSAHLRLEDEKVSRIHAVIEVSAAGEVNIIDMVSAEGTFVNGERVNKAPLNPGDEIRLGDTRLVFQEDEARPAAAEQPEAATQPELEPVGAAEEPEVDAGATAAAADSGGYAAPDLGADEEEAAAEQEPEPEQAPVQASPGPYVEDKYAAEPDETPAAASAAATSSAPVEVPVEGYYTHRVALPPPKELGELDDDETVGAANWTLEVRQLWGRDTVLNVKVFRPDDKQVSLGEDKKADFHMPVESLPADDFPIARVESGQVMLSFSANASGEVRYADGKVADLGELARSAAARQDPKFPDCRSLPLDQGASATIEFGNVAFRFRYVSRPAGYLSRLTENLDYTFLNTILLMFFAFAALVATFHLRPKSVETTEEELYKVPDRFVQFILTRPKPEKKDLNFLAKLKADINAKKADSAARHKGKEGKMGQRGKPDTGKRSAVRAIKRDDEEVVGNKGLLAVLGAGGPQGLSTVTGGTGLGGELEGAIGNMYGGQVGSSGGFGGLGLKGTGAGGGGVGNTIGVGRLGTRGRGGGKYGYGSGVSRVRKRGERNVNISVGRPIVMGSLSMEIIRRVIHSHRDQIKYCYSKELTRNPNLAGKVTVKFTISAKGYVQQASVSATTLGNATVERCITQKVRTWKFPEPKGGGIVIVNYPFILKPQ